MALDAFTRSQFLWLGLVLIAATLIATIVVFRGVAAISSAARRKAMVPCRATFAVALRETRSSGR
jgi:hypothetical protein